MGGNNWLAERFEENRPHLRAVAFRMLGSTSEADDAVQEAWVRLSRSDTSAVENLGGWLTTVVGRVSLDMLRARKSRHEEPFDERIERAGGIDPADEALVADSVGPALLVVLEALTPAERLAFVLHDMFGVPFEEIAPIVARSPTATRQLASRARRRIQGSPAPAADHTRQRGIVDAFLAASRNGEFEALLALLDPNVVLRTDAAAQAIGATEATGAPAVATTFSGRAKGARLALINNAPGAIWTQGGTPKVAFTFTIENETITEIAILADLEDLVMEVF